MVALGIQLTSSGPDVYDRNEDSKLNELELTRQMVSVGRRPRAGEAMDRIRAHDTTKEGRFNAIVKETYANGDYRLKYEGIARHERVPSSMLSRGGMVMFFASFIGGINDQAWSAWNGRDQKYVQVEPDFFF